MSWKPASRGRILMHLFWALPQAQPPPERGDQQGDWNQATLPVWFPVGHPCTCRQIVDGASSANTNAGEPPRLLGGPPRPSCREQLSAPCGYVGTARWEVFWGVTLRPLWQIFQRRAGFLLVMCGLSPSSLILLVPEGDPLWLGFVPRYPRYSSPRCPSGHSC